MHPRQRPQRPIPHRRLQLHALAQNPEARSDPSNPSTGTRRNAAPVTTASTTRSFSSGSSEQVEYTSRPPTASRCNAPLRIARCRAACRVSSSACSRCRISGFRASVPVPLHGTSHRIRSNSPSAFFSTTLASATAHFTRVAIPIPRQPSLHLRRPPPAHVGRQHLGLRPPAPPAPASSHPEPRSNPKSSSHPAQPQPPAPPPAATHHP